MSLGAKLVIAAAVVLLLLMVAAPGLVVQAPAKLDRAIGGVQGLEPVW